MSILNRVVVILVNFNSLSDTYDCMKSIFLSKASLPYIIIVDNASKNAESLEVLYNQFENLKIIYNTKNIGFGRANNVGINWAKNNLEFDFLLLLNNDTLIEPDTLNKLTEPFSKDDSIGIVTGKTMFEGNRDLVWYGGGFINYSRGWPRITDYYQKPTADGANSSKYVTFVSGCVMMFTRKSISNLGGFDNDIFMYSEDLELSIRAVKKGFSCWYNSEAIIYHKVQGSFADKGVPGFNKNNPNLSFLFYNMKKNQWIVMFKHLNLTTFLKFNLFYWPELFYRTIIFLTWGRFDLVKTSISIMTDIFRFRIKSNRLINPTTE